MIVKSILGLSIGLLISATFSFAPAVYAKATRRPAAIRKEKIPLPPCPEVVKPKVGKNCSEPGKL